MDCKVALLDGGATHALRQGSAAELRDGQPVSVEFVHGWPNHAVSRDGCSTLLSKEPIEVILPMRLLVENGDQVKWSSNECGAGSEPPLSKVPFKAGLKGPSPGGGARR